MVSQTCARRELSARGLQIRVVRADLTGAEPAIGSKAKRFRKPENMAAPLEETRPFACIDLSSEKKDVRNTRWTNRDLL
jgi:hypothetical protein